MFARTDRTAVAARLRSARGGRNPGQRTRKLLLGSTALVAASLASPALAADHPVANYADLVAAINAANATSGDTITLTGDVTLSGLLPAIRSGVTVLGGGHTIDGASTYRIFFIDTGAAAVSLQSVVLANGVAQGGNGGLGGGGGGLGAGGAIFVNTGAVTATDVSFSANAAKGGNGANLPSNGSGGGGGGGLGGGGGVAGNSGGGGGGYSGGGGGGGAGTYNGSPNGSPAGAGGAGPGGAGGAGSATAAGQAGTNGGSGGSGFTQSSFTYGGGGGGGGANGGAGGGHQGGGGGGAGYTGAGGVGGTGAGSGAGGNGGIGGGGGGSAGFGAGGNAGDFGGGGGAYYNFNAGAGGFGGGGGGGYGYSSGSAGFAGNGGFGGGGGASGGSPTVGTGGVGAGTGSTNTGGGGLGAGGAVFVRAGGSLTINGSTSITGGSAAGGTRGASTVSGVGAGSALFLQGNQTLTINVGAAQTTTIANSIADDSAVSLPGGTYTAGTGAGANLTKTGAGTLVLTGANTLGGQTTVAAGTLSLGGTGSGRDVYVTGGALTLTSTTAVSGTIHAIDPTINYDATGTYAAPVSLEVASGSQATDPTILNNRSGGSVTLSGSITEGAGFSNQYVTFQGGAGSTTTLTNTANSWTGVTRIEPGATLQGTTGTISGGSIVDNGTLAYNQAASGTVGQDISGTGVVTVSGLAGSAGPITFNGALTNDGGLTLGTGGYVVINGSVSSASTTGAILVTGANDTITVTAGHSVSSTQTAGGDYASAIYGTGANFTVTNAGTISAPGDLGISTTYGSNGIYAANGVTVNNTGNIFGLPQGSAATYRSDGVITFGTSTVNNTGATVSGGTLIGAVAGGGVITGGWEGAYLTDDGTVYNSGTIAGTFYSGVEIQGVGVLNNYTGGQIIGGSDGANIGRTATVYNSGLIAAGSYDSATQLVTLGAGGNGLVLNTGGTVTNAAGGLMTGGQGGIRMLGLGSMTVTNPGTITGTSTGSAGIGQSNNGSLTVTNNSGGIIAGTANAINTTSNGVVSITNNVGGKIGTGTVDNAGVFTAGGNGNAISLVSGTVTNSGTIDGSAGGVVATGALTLTNTGTITSHGTGTGNFDGVTVIGIANILNSGTITGGGYAAIYTAAGGTITNAVAGQLIGAGSAAMVLDGGGTFNNYGSATNPGGAGVASGNANTTVNLFAGSSTGSVTLGGGDDTLAIYNGRGTSGAATVDGPTGITLQSAGTLAAASFGAINLGGGANTLMLRGGGDGTAANGAAGSFAISTSTGASILTKADSGTWTLTGAAITPTLTINAGTGGTPGSGGLLVFNGTTGLAGTINVNGATIRAATAGAFGTGTINAIDPTIQYGATGTYTNNIVLQSTNPSTDPTRIQADAGVNAALTGLISQSGGTAQPLIFDGFGTVTLTNGGNNYAGLTTISNGTVVERNTGTALGTGGATITSGAVLQFDNQTGGVNYIEGGTYSGAGTIRFTGNANSVTALGNGGNGNTIFSLSSDGLIDVVSGSVNGSSSGQGFWTNNKGSLNIASGAIFDGVEGVVIVDKLTGTGTLRGGFFGSGSTTVGIDNGSASFGGVIANSTNANSPLNLIKAGTGTQTLTGTNSYTGTTTISGGTLALSGTGSIANTSVTDNAIFSIAGLTNGGTSIVNLSGNGSVVLGANTLTLSNASGTYGGSVSGAGALVLAAGSKTFSGALTNDGGLTLGTGVSVVINGSVSSASTNGAIQVTGANDTIAVTAGHSVTSTQTAGGDYASAIYGTGANFTVTNAGTISAPGDLGATFGSNGIYAANGVTVNNTGNIFGLPQGSAATYRSDGVIVFGTGIVNNTGATLSGATLTGSTAGGGVITGGWEAVYLTDDGTVHNSGTIAGTYYSGVEIQGFGTLNNYTGGRIVGGSDGANIGRTATVNNSGLIAAGSYDSASQIVTLGADGKGLVLNAGGTVTNTAGGQIVGGASTNAVNYGLLSLGALTLTNSGTITGGTYGVSASAGGSLTNLSGGTISGNSGAMLLAGSAGYSLDLRSGSTANGTIDASATSGANATLLAGTLNGGYLGGSGADNVSLLAGGSFSGQIDGGAGIDAFTTNLGSAGSATISLANIANFESLTHLSGSLTLTGATASPAMAIYAGTGSPAGIVIFNGTTGLTGDIYVNGATIRANNAGAFGSGTIHAIDPTIQFAASGTYANNISLEVQSPASANPTILQSVGSNSITLSGAITTGAGAGVDPNQPLTFDGSGSTFRLTNAANSWSGATTITAGTSLLGRTDTISGGSIVDNGTLTYLQDTNGTVAQAISGNGFVVIDGSGNTNTITFSGDNSVAGGFTSFNPKLAFTGSNTSAGTVVFLNGANAQVDVAAGGSLTSIATNAVRANQANATVNNLGAISGADANLATVQLNQGGTVNNGSSTSATASISGTYAAIASYGANAFTLTNYGTISAGSYGVYTFTPSTQITNSGTITATGAGGQAISLNGGGSVTNLAGGTISGANAVLAIAGILSVDNAGAINGAVTAASGALTLTNRTGGAISNGGVAVLGQAGGTVTNAGSIRSTNSVALSLFGGSANVTNQTGGSIAGVFGINATTLTLANAGQIVGSSSAVSASAASTVTNSGLIGNGALSGGVFTRGTNSGNAINLAGGTVTNNNGGQIISSTGWSGIAFASGTGTVNNNAGATITGGASAIFSQSGVTSTSITNAGTMTADTNAVIFIGAGTLTLTNQAGGTIRSNGSNAIFNAGSGASSVTNAGTITGQQQGVWVTGGTLALTNSGSITANGGYGIIANAGGSVTNLSGGTIGGSSGSMLLAGSSAYTLDLRAGSTVNGTIQAGTTSGTNTTSLAGALNGGYVGGSGADNFTLFDTGAFTGVVEGGAAIDTFTLAGNGSSTVDGSRIVNFENLIKTGTGTRTFNGSNVSFTDIQVQQGTLAVSGGNAINNGALVTVATPATLSLLSDEAIGGLAGSGAVTLGANTLILAGPQVTSFSGVISGTGGFIRAGTGATTLSGANTYTGMTEVAGGSLILGASNVIADASTLLIDAGGVLDLGQFSDTVALAVINGTLNGTGTLTATQYQLNGATVNANLGAGTLFQLGGVSLLNGTADAGNVSVNAGTLRLGAANRLADNATVAVNSGATLDLQTFNDTVGIASSSGTLNGSGTLTAGEYDLNGATVNANLGAGNLFQLGGTTLLNGTAGAANVMINGGTLRLGAAERLSNSAALAIASGGTLDLAGFQETVGTAYIAGTLNGTGTLIASQYALAGGTVNANLGAGALFNQSGVSTLNGTSAATTLGIVAGTLRLGASERLNDKIDVVINSGGVLDLNGFQETIDSLDGSGSVALGAGRLRVGADNGSSTFAGIISGSGSFEKFGTGLFVYGNNQLYTGGTTVTAGELRLLGSTAGNVNVNAGTFSGGGTINGRLSLAGGTIAPGTGTGTFAGFQSTTFSSSAGNFAVDVSPTQSDFLIVTGAATLNGGLVQTNIVGSSAQFQFRQLYTVLQAGNLTGTFANPTGFVQTSTNSDLYQRLRYDLAANSVVLEIRKMVDFTTGAGSPNQAAIGAALNSTRLGASDDFAGLLNALGQLTPAQQSAALDTLGNEGVADGSIVLGFIADRFVDLIDNRMDGTDRLLGSGNDAFGGQPVASSRTMATIGQALSLTGGHGGGGAGTGPWMKAYGFNSRLDGTPGIANLRTNGRGFTFGLDGQVGNLVLGGAVGVVDFDAATTSRATTTEGTAWQGGLYARLRSGGTFAGVSGTYIDSDYDTSRAIQVGALSGTARGNASARVWTAEAVAGHDFALSSTAQFGVLGTVRFSDIDQHAYAELGNGVFNLNHDAERRQYEIETAVARASNSFAMGNGLNLNASVRGGVAFAQGDLTAALRSTFAGAPAGTGAFTTNGASLPSSWGVVGAGLNLTPQNNRWEVSLRYEGRYGSRLAEHQVALGVGIRW